MTAKTLEQIRLLSNLETNCEKLIQIVLVGQPELRETLNDPTLGPGYMRVTTALPEDNRRFLEAMREVLSQT